MLDVGAPFSQAKGQLQQTDNSMSVGTDISFLDFSLPTPTEQKIEIRTNPNNTIDEVVGVIVVGTNVYFVGCPLAIFDLHTLSNQITARINLTISNSQFPKEGSLYDRQELLCLVPIPSRSVHREVNHYIDCGFVR